jgi:hypothetical protein
VLDQAVTLRQQHRMSLGDALVAATALVHRLPLATHNIVFVQLQLAPHLTVVMNTHARPGLPRRVTRPVSCP